MEEMYFWEENYDKYINESKIIGSGYESCVYSLNDQEVLKILNGSFQKGKVKKNIKYIASYPELESFVTLPTGLVYLDMHFIGYRMDYAGVNLVEYLLEHEDISFDDRIKILLKVRECLEKLHEYNIIHSDLQFKNVLINGNIDSVKISDINSAKTSYFNTGLLNKMTEHLKMYYGYVKELDIMSYNVMCDYLLSYDAKNRRDFIFKGADEYFNYAHTNHRDNVFDPSVYEEQISLIKNPVRRRKKDAKNTKYLIDYIK